MEQETLDNSPAQFLTNLLTIQCLLLQANEGAILRLSSDKKVEVLTLYSPSNGKPAWIVQSVESITKALSTDNVIVTPHASLNILTIRLNMNDLNQAVAVFLVETGDRKALETKCRTLQLAMRLVNLTETRISQHGKSGDLRRFQQAMETLSTINNQDQFTQIAMAFCNEVASQWQCERASIGFLKDRYIHLRAMSHTEDFSRKMEIVQNIESAMEECLDQDVEVLSPAPEGPANRIFNHEEIETLRLTCELCSARLADLYEHGRWFGATMAIKARDYMAKIAGPKQTTAKFTVIICAGIILFLIFAKGQFRVETPFALEATFKQVIPSPFDGYIKEVDVEVNEPVEANKTVMAILDTAELRLQLAAAKAENARYLKQSTAALQDRKIAEAYIARANADKMTAEIDLLNYQLSRADIVSPISGIVTKGDLKRQIGAPVKTGDVLFEVSPLESLRAELLVPEDDIYDIQPGQEGQMATASFPGKRIKFLVEHINPVAEVVNQRNVFKVRVNLQESYTWLRPGMEGVARVSIGKRRYAWIWTRKIVNWARMKLWI